MDDQRTDRESGASIGRSRFSSGMKIALLLMAPVCLPLVLIGVAMLEDTIFGTASICKLYQQIGIFEPLLMIHDAIASLFGR